MNTSPPSGLSVELLWVGLQQSAWLNYVLAGVLVGVLVWIWHQYMSRLKSIELKQGHLHDCFEARFELASTARGLISERLARLEEGQEHMQRALEQIAREGQQGRTDLSSQLLAVLRHRGES